MLGGEGLVADADWPRADPALLTEADTTYAVQVNGKMREKVVLPRGMAAAEVEAAVMALPKIAQLLGGAAPRKLIVVPDRLVNIVA